MDLQQAVTKRRSGKALQNQLALFQTDVPVNKWNATGNLLVRPDSWPSTIVGEQFFKCLWPEALPWTNVVPFFNTK